MRTRIISGFAAVVLTISTLPTAAQADEGGATKAVVPVFALDGPIVERPVGDDFLFGSVGSEPLKDLVARMHTARDDDGVKAVVLLLGNTAIGQAQIEEIRRAMHEIKAAGKPIHTHADQLTTGAYMLLSGASEISMSPTGDIWITGLYAESPYLRGLFDKIGITPDALTCGAYKSAAEIFMRSGPSPEAQRMLDWLMDSFYDTTVDLIASGRDVAPETVRAWIDRGLFSAEKAKEAGIIDSVQFRQDFVAELQSRYGENVEFDKRYARRKGPEFDFSSPFAMFKILGDLFKPPTSKAQRKDAVAIVYVEGPILPGHAAPSPFAFGGMPIAYSTPIRKALDQAADDESVKAVVLRVNSPGGSVVASEIILDATKRVKADKPIVVSMGDVAGSGGYYVACGVDTIFADRATVTGSIGVVATKLATTDMWNNIGISWHVAQRGAKAGMLSSGDVFSVAERQRLQAWMDEVYETFKGHVRQARGDRLAKDLEELAGGRVYTGEQALALGLIDKIGGLDDAIRHVADAAELTDYEVRVIPRPKNIFEMLMGDLGDESSEQPTLAVGLRTLADASRRSFIDQALPYLEGLHPARVRAVKAALHRLSLLQRVPAAVMMPEIIIGER